MPRSRRIAIATSYARSAVGSHTVTWPILRPGEFFAVVSEAFFETPELLAPTYPALYEQLRLFYRQDPLARLSASPSA